MGFKKGKDRLAYPSRRGYKRIAINYAILDMLLYSIILATLHFVYLSKIEDEWLYYIFNKKLFIFFLFVIIVSYTASIAAKFIVGSQNKIVSLKKIFIMIISSFLTALVLYLDIIIILFNQYSIITTLLAVLGLKIINIVVSYAIGGALL